MIVGRIGGISPDGKTVLYDAQTQEMVSLPLPMLDRGVEIEKDAEGTWRIVFGENTLPISPKKEGETEESYQKRVREREKKIFELRETEKFYHATKAFLPYKDYQRVAKRFPSDCYAKYLANPFYLTDIQGHNEEAPICSVPAVDRNIILETFDDRLNEMKYVFRHVLLSEESAGNTWISIENFRRKVFYLLQKDGHPLFTGDVLPYLRYYDQDFVLKNDGSGVKVGLAVSYAREKAIYRKISEAVSRPSRYPKFCVTWKEGMVASKAQVNAVNNLIAKGGGFTILTGGPGTGKTTTLKLIVTEIGNQYPGLETYLLSPTGRAAKRIQEVFGNMPVKVSTVHRFIGFGREGLGADVTKTIEGAGLIILDEASMIDLEIFKRFIELVNFKNTKVILVGDVDQLPSIGAGNVLHDLIALGVRTERLTENFRSNGPVVQNGMKINAGDPMLIYNEHFQIVPYPKAVSDYFAGRNEDAEIVITPYRKKKTSGNTNTVNLVAQARIFEGAPMVNEKFRIGDVVIMMRTNYKNGYYNGESGRIVTHFPNGDWLVSFDDGRNVLVSREDDMDLGYAGTVHKCQGSEYDKIVIDIPEFNKFVTRRMLYTAVTRAKTDVVIHSTKEILRKVIMNNPEEVRNTWLSTFEPFMILH